MESYFLLAEKYKWGEIKPEKSLPIKHYSLTFDYLRDVIHPFFTDFAILQDSREKEWGNFSFITMLKEIRNLCADENLEEEINKLPIGSKIVFKQLWFFLTRKEKSFAKSFEVFRSLFPNDICIDEMVKKVRSFGLAEVIDAVNYNNFGFNENEYIFVPEEYEDIVTCYLNYFESEEWSVQLLSEAYTNYIGKFSSYEEAADKTMTFLYGKDIFFKLPKLLVNSIDFGKLGKDLENYNIIRTYQNKKEGVMYVYINRDAFNDFENNK